MYCTKCGKKLSPDAKFCDGCGAPTAADDSTRKVKYTGEIQKCPNCGEVLKSFAVNCPACGHEIRNTKQSNSIKEFTRKLEDLEAQREENKSKADRKNINKTDEKIATLIKTYSIPNNKEDIFDFIILATSNIDISYETYAHLRRNASEKVVTDAWLAKMEQAYQKAKISFSEEPQFDNIKDLYEKTKKQILIRKSIRAVIILIIIGLIATLLF